MPARSKARKRALDVLFESELRGLPVLELLAERITLGSPPVPAYAADLVRGVAVHSARIGEEAVTHSIGWMHVAADREYTASPPWPRSV